MTVIERLGERFWFVPAVLCVVAAALAEGLMALDQYLEQVLVPDWLGVVIYRVGESGSRDLLGAIASSSLAVAGTTFSITMAVLALTSSTYGPRLVRNFMTDRGNQVVLGVFVATFLYSLLVLRSIRVLGDAGDETFVPHLAVNVAFLLAVLDVGVLVYFIHHISDSIQVPTMAGRVRSELVGAVDRLYPLPVGEGSRRPEEDPDPPDPASGEGVLAERSGYVLAVDGDDLVEVASSHDVVVALVVSPGEHVLAGDLLLTVHGAEASDDELRGSLRSAVDIGSARTPVQDIDFAVQQLTEMAVRALSPGTNDPYTAITALDDLTVGLVRLVGRERPSTWRRGPDGRARVYAPSVDRARAVASVLEAVRWYATGSPAVVRRAVNLARRVGGATDSVDVHAALRRELQLLVEAFAAADHSEHDVESITRAVRDAAPGTVIPPR